MCIYTQMHAHTDNTQITPRYPTPVPIAVLAPDGEPCGNVPCAEVRGWELGMSQFSEVEWLLPFDLSWYSRKFLGVQDVKTGLLTSLAKYESLNGLKHLGCISQVGYVSLHGTYKLHFAKLFVSLILGPRCWRNHSPRPCL